MDLGKYFSKDFYKKLARVVYEDAIKPAAAEYVKKTDNPYDDMALKFIDDFVNDFLADK